MAESKLAGLANIYLLPFCKPGCNRSGWYPATDDQGREVVRPCPGCQSLRLVGQFGTEVCSWLNWEYRREIASPVDQLRAWRGGQEWACLLHAGDLRKHPLGNRGSGKSHAMQATAHEWAERGRTVRYIAVPDLIQQHREAIGDGSMSAPALADFDGLLLLDDLAVGNVTPWVQEILERLADYRRRHLLPTLISTNKDLARLEAEFPRLVDRCFEGLVIEWQAPSWRRR
jgi:hypothetical protein